MASSIFRDKFLIIVRGCLLMMSWTKGEGVVQHKVIFDDNGSGGDGQKQILHDNKDKLWKYCSPQIMQ